MFLQTVAAVLPSRADRSLAPVHAVVVCKLEFGISNFGFFSGQAIRTTAAAEPSRVSFLPAYFAWHRREVFRGQARDSIWRFCASEPLQAAELLRSGLSSAA